MLLKFSRTQFTFVRKQNTLNLAGTSIKNISIKVIIECMEANNWFKVIDDKCRRMINNLISITKDHCIRLELQ